MELNNLQYVNYFSKCSNDYTIVSAVYNVEQYLEDYFFSIVSQSVDFSKHIKIILIDDGSTDGSAEIIKKWQSIFPNNITYIYKENGGQASARNLGLKEVDTEWVTFIDPDDFISRNYFEELDKQISLIKNDLILVASNLLYYFETNKQVKDSHPLNFKFTKNVVFTLKENIKHIQLGTNSALFRSKIILSNNILFDERVKPAFEDAKFIGDYLLANDQDKKISFIKTARYYYRKRGDSSSTVDTVWQKKEMYYDVIRYGALALLEKSKNDKNQVLTYLQHTVIYYLLWHIKYLLNNERKISWLNQIEKNKFLDTFIECFELIEPKTILSHDLANCWFMHKVGMLGALKQVEPPYQIVYIKNVDITRKQILLSYFYYFEHQDSVMLDGVDITPMYAKTTENEFVGKIFCYERRYWIPYVDEKQNMQVFIAGKEAKLSIKGNNVTPKQVSNIKISDIINLFKSNKYDKQDNSWILMDRKDKAGDNAEYLYRWIAQNHPEHKIYYALERDSLDWNRLAQDGFNLLDFASLEYENQLVKSSKIISSHLEPYFCNYFGDHYQYQKQYVFLQHGITKDDISNYINQNCEIISLLITSTNNEYNYFLSDPKYKLSAKEVVCTGFARHDYLYNNNNNNQNSSVILIMPSWRKWLKDIDIQTFLSSEYYKHWYNFLQSSKLRELVRTYNYEVIFSPHFNLAAYLPYFSVPEYVKVLSQNDDTTSLQTLFKNANLMITDYSSNSFEMAYLEKGTLYYQFDKDEFFARHTYGQGYFNYENDAFGAVAYTEKELLDNLEQILKNNGNFAEKYRKNMDIFAFRDKNNCERIYKAILSLDLPEQKTYPDLNILRERLDRAIKFSAWKLVFRLATELKKHIRDPEEISSLENLQADAIVNGKLRHIYNEFMPIICKKYPQNEDVMTAYIDQLIKKENWSEIIKVVESLTPELKSKFNYPYILSLWKQGDIQTAYANLPKINGDLTYDHLNLAAEISLLIGDKRTAKQFYITMIQKFPNKNKAELLMIINQLSEV